MPITLPAIRDFEFDLELCKYTYSKSFLSMVIEDIRKGILVKGNVRVWSDKLMAIAVSEGVGDDVLDELYDKTQRVLMYIAYGKAIGDTNYSRNV